MARNNTKSQKVLDSALHLLQSKGHLGLTMRQVAMHAGMSLSNVQYYYANKNDLLKAIADHYFSACLDELSAMDSIDSSTTVNEAIENMLRIFLSHGLQVSEMCRIFREYWAISARNADIDAHIRRYYQDMALILSEKLRPAAKTEKHLSEAVSILIPFVEGYSITALAMPEKIGNITKILTEWMLTLLNK